MPQPQETELKLLLPGLNAAQAYRRLREAPALKGLRAQKHQLLNRYFDTPNHALQQLRCALRVRHTQAAGRARPDHTAPWIQTFKTAGTDRGGLSQRGEWNTPLPGPELNHPALQAAAPHLPGLPTDWTAHLQPCFETHCLRTTWQVQTNDGACIEVALDAGSIHAQGHVEPLLELELELLNGPTEALLALAQALAAHVPVLPSDRSKAERGYALAAGAGPQPTRARPVDLPARATPPQVACQVLPEVFAQFTRNLDTLLLHHTPEVVHQTRVAWRRWRSLCKLLAPWLPPAPDTQALHPLLQELGLLRDTDVARVDTLPRWAARYTQHVGASAPAALSAWPRALAALDQQAQGHWDQVRAHLGSPHTGACLLDLVVWLQTPMVLTSPTPPPHWAIRRIHRWYQRARKQLAKPGGGTNTDTDTQHQARLLAKRVRYATEALAHGWSKPERRRAQRWLQQAAGWQVGLGTERDTQQAAQVLARAGAPAVVTAFMAGVGAGLTGR